MREWDRLKGMLATLETKFQCNTFKPTQYKLKIMLKPFTEKIATKYIIYRQQGCML